MAPLLSDIDSQTLNAIRAGDHAAFRRFYTEYLDLMLRFAYSYTHSTTSAQDVVADVFVAIWERRATWNPQQSLRAYLLGAVRNRSLDYLRRQRTGDRVAQDHHHADIIRATTASPAVSPDIQIEHAEDRRRLRDAIAHLSPDRRRALMLRWQEGLSPVEIANVMGIPRASVDQLISRSIKQLRAIFSE